MKQKYLSHSFLVAVLFILFVVPESAYSQGCFCELYCGTINVVNGKPNSPVCLGNSDGSVIYCCGTTAANGKYIFNDITVGYTYYISVSDVQFCCVTVSSATSYTIDMSACLSSCGTPWTCTCGSSSKNKVGDPIKFALLQNYPNPFNPVTKINYSVASPTNVKVTIYDALGDEVFTLVHEFKNAGEYSVDFDGSNLASGVYIYKIQAGSFTDVKKMLLLK